MKALSNVESLPERDQVLRMNPKSLTVKDGIVLIRIMREKSNELNNKFKTDFWTPRKIDKVLWACRE